MDGEFIPWIKEEVGKGTMAPRAEGSDQPHFSFNEEAVEDTSYAINLKRGTDRNVFIQTRDSNRALLPARSLNPSPEREQEEAAKAVTERNDVAKEAFGANLWVTIAWKALEREL